MKKQLRYSPKVIERAVRIVSEAASQYESQWAAFESIAAKIGCTPETLHRLARRNERAIGQRPGQTSAEQQQIKALEREVRELRKANEILRMARSASPCLRAEPICKVMQVAPSA